MSKKDSTTTITKTLSLKSHYKLVKSDQISLGPKQNKGLNDKSKQVTQKGTTKNVKRLDNNKNKDSKSKKSSQTGQIGSD